jgi:hypothetical protein
MNPLFKSLALLVAVLPVGVSASGPVLKKAIQLEDLTIDYRVYLSSEPGTILIDPYRLEKGHGVAHLVALDAEGAPLFHRAFEHRFRPMVLSDFKEIEPGILGYFVSTFDQGRWSAKRYFLDLGFQDLFPHPVPNFDPDLDGRWAAHRPGGGELFLFSRRRRQVPGQRTGEIQELDARGNTPFTWSAEDFLKLPRDRKGSLELSSVAWGSDSSLVLAMAATQEVVKIGYPMGNPLWRLSSRDWKFIADPQNGFRAPYSVVPLKDGNILMIDSRDAGEQTRAVEYRLDVENKTATLVWQYIGSYRGPVGYDATVQRLKNGNTLIAWPTSILEVTPKGEVAREWLFSSGYGSPSAFFLEK